MRVSKTDAILEVDLHGLTTEDAKCRLEHLLSCAGPEIREVRVIHGYNSGQALRNMVRVRLKHPRIASKLITLNPGETRLLLTPPAKAAKKRNR